MTRQKNILITDVCDPILLKGLKDLNFVCEYMPEIEQEKFSGVISDYYGIVISSKLSIRKKEIDSSKSLKLIARMGSGMDNIDVDYAESKNIHCVSSPEGNADSVAEHALGLLLSLLHNIPNSFSEIKNLQWLVEKNRVTELSGKTVGIIGYGNTGKAFAKRLKNFDVKVLAYDKYLKKYSDEFVTESSNEEIFAQADVVSLHIPLTEETKNLADEKFFCSFQKNIYLINTSRGKILYTSDLLAAIKTGKIIGAGMDVLDNENIDHYNESEKSLLLSLLETNKVVMTPHVAGKSFECRKKYAEILLQKIRSLL